MWKTLLNVVVNLTIWMYETYNHFYLLCVLGILAQLIILCSVVFYCLVIPYTERCYPKHAGITMCFLWPYHLLARFTVTEENIDGNIVTTIYLGTRVSEVVSPSPKKNSTTKTPLNSIKD